MSDSHSNAAAGGKPASPPTVSHILGEITWLLSQSPLHKVLQIGDIEWLIMPAVIHEQFYVFREGERPVGLALWAKCTPAAEKKLDGGMIEPANRLTLDEWREGDRIWLVDLIAPFATAENRHREIMIADLVSGPLSGREFRFHQTDAVTGRRAVQIVPADAGARIKAALEAAIESAEPKS